MKKLMLCLLCCCFLSMPMEIKAKTNQIVITSKQIPYIFLVEIQGDEQLRIDVLPSDLYIPNEHSTLLSLKKETSDVIKDRINSTFHKSLNSKVEIDIDAVDEDFETNHTSYDMHTMKGITDYFEKLKDNITIQDILHYQRYISSDLNLSDYYQFYRMFQNRVQIEYHYMPYMIMDDHKYPMARF